MNFNALFNNSFFTVDVIYNGKCLKGIFQESDINYQLRDVGIIGNETKLTLKHDDYIKYSIALDDEITVDSVDYFIREIKNLKDSTVEFKLEEK